MADAKAKCSLRYLLQRYLEKTEFFNSIKIEDEVTKNTLLDNIVKEINDTKEFSEHLQKIEKEANVYAKYLQLQFCARGFAESVKNIENELFNKDGSVKNKDALMKSLNKALTTIKDDSQIKKIVK